MARRIIIKTVCGRQYRYERVSTKRKKGKVTTQDKYLGPVVVAKRGKIEQTPTKTQQGLKKLYRTGYPVKELVSRLRDTAGIKVSESTIRNYMKREGVGRMVHWSEPRSESAKEGWAKKRHAEKRKQRSTAYHAEILLEEGAITAKDLIAMSGALDEKIVAASWAKREKRRKSKKRQRK